MPDAGSALIGGTSLLGGSMQASASREAAEVQAASQAQALAEQRRQFDIASQQLQPFGVGDFGSEAIIRSLQRTSTPFLESEAGGQLLALLGVPTYGGSTAGLEAAQQAEISRIEQSPAFREQVRQGEEALLQRASATGGLRGGNIQAALAQFRPQLLSQEIDKRISQLGGIAGAQSEQALQALNLRGAAAARQASSGVQFGQNIGQTLGNIGAAQAQGALSGGRAVAGQFISSLPQLLGQYQGGGGSLFGGSGFSPADQAYLAGRTTTQYSPF
jgi:hypothetical protein